MKAFLELMRPVNCLMASMAAIIGLLMAGGREASTAILVFWAAFMVTGAGNAVNDYFDREIDALNRPNRPIPSGRIAPESSLIWSGILFASGCLLAGIAGLLCLFIALANSILLFFYARDLKATPLAGNLAVSILTGSTFIFGGSALGWTGLFANWIPFSLSSLATMSREVAKDMEDMAGDIKGGAKTFPILAGEKISAVLAALFALAAVILSYQPELGRAYLALVALADFFLLGGIVMILRRDASGSQRAFKLGMAVALLAFLAAALYT